MNQALGLRMLGKIMKWDDERARKEFDWLRLMARWQYDGYSDFLAGVRFIESLAAWLQQFDADDREIAYKLVRKDLVYICTSKMQHLVEHFYPCFVEPRLLSMVSTKLRIPKYQIWSNEDATKEFHKLKRRTLFMALSEGARIDSFRHANSGRLSNEQLVIATQVDKDKWKDMLKSLREESGNADAQFKLVYLIDDFMGTGTSFLRYDDEKREWKGKLVRFGDSISAASAAIGGGDLFENESHICVHHYIASYDAAFKIQSRMSEAKKDIGNLRSFQDINFSFGLVLPLELPIDKDPARNEELIKLTQKYYDPIIRTPHTDVGKVYHMELGYGGCALPLVLEHNTPNNSIALLWAETDGEIRDGVAATHAMRPLFRRRQRHY